MFGYVYYLLLWGLAIEITTISGSASTITTSVTKFSEEDLNCDTKNNEKVDDILAKIMVIGEFGRKYPENRKQLKIFCEYVLILSNEIFVYY